VAFGGTHQTLIPGNMSWGIINGSTGATSAGSGDFTSAKTGTGRYEITWTKAKGSATYAVVVAANSSTSVFPPALVESTTWKFVVQTWGEAAKETANQAFSFIVMAAS